MPDRGKVRRSMMAAFAHVSPNASFSQASLRERVGDPEDVRGRDEMEIGEALTHGANLPGEFTDDEAPFVNDAFARFGGTPPSRQISECCVGMLRLAKRR